MSSGVYAIRNTVTGQCYVGGASDIGSRRSGHFCMLKGGCHHCKPLQESFNVHGRAAFVFEVLEECRGSLLGAKEREWVDRLSPEFNTGTVGTSFFNQDYTRKVGTTVTPEMYKILDLWGRDQGHGSIGGTVRRLLVKGMRAEGLLPKPAKPKARKKGGAK